MNTMTAKENPDHMFTLKLPIGKGLFIHAFHDGPWPGRGNGEKISVEVVLGDEVIFPRGQLYCGTPAIGGVSVDGIEARELVGSLVAMKPGDTDRDYFESYTEDQLDFAVSHGEQIQMVVMDAYCDDGGNVRKDLDSENDMLEDT